MRKFDELGETHMHVRTVEPLIVKELCGMNHIVPTLILQTGVSAFVTCQGKFSS